MKFQSQKIAYWFFASAMGLLLLQIVYGFIMGFARIGMDGLHEWIPFNTARAVHTNLLVVWLLLGFMGSAAMAENIALPPTMWTNKIAHIFNHPKYGNIHFTEHLNTFARIQ